MQSYYLNLGVVKNRGGRPSPPVSGDSGGGKTIAAAAPFLPSTQPRRCRRVTPKSG